MKTLWNVPLLRAGACLCLGACAALLLSRSAAAGRLYLIRDGDQVLFGQYRTDDPMEALDAAGVTLSPRDSVTVGATAGATDISISRGVSVTLLDGDKAAAVVTRTATVEALLQEAGVQIGELDRVEPEGTAPVRDGMTVTVTRVRTEEITSESAIGYSTVTREDDTLPVGEQTVLSEGEPGILARTIRAVLENGRVVSREILRETVRQAPRDRVILVGTKEVPVYAQPGPTVRSGVITTASGETYSYSRVMTADATAYSCDGRQGMTATGTPTRYGVVAVDPSVIPYGTRMYIVTDDGAYIYGLASAEDCGEAILGNRIDLYFETYEESCIFGRRSCTVYFLD